MDLSAWVEAVVRGLRLAVRTLSKSASINTPASVAASNPLNPETISLAALVLGMLLIALVSIGGFTVLAQRRMRSIGMLESIGATDRHVRLVISANGAVVGIAGATLGFVLGIVLWFAYRPSLEQSSHHLIGVLALSWPVTVAVTHVNRWTGAAVIGVAGLIYSLVVLLLIDRTVLDNGERLWFRAVVESKLGRFSGKSLFRLPVINSDAATSAERPGFAFRRSRRNSTVNRL